MGVIFKNIYLNWGSKCCPYIFSRDHLPKLIVHNLIRIAILCHTCVNGAYLFGTGELVFVQADITGSSIISPSRCRAAACND